MILRRSSRTDPARAFVLPIGAQFAALVALAAVVALSSAAAAQSPPRSPADQTSKPDDAIKQRDQDLDAALARQRESVEAQAKLRSEIEVLSQDRRKFNAQLIDTAGRVRDVEASINATQTRLDGLKGQEQALQKTLDQRRAVIVEVIAALQRMGRQPPPALIVTPEDALHALRTAITLGAVLPEMRAQADALAGDLAALVNVRQEIVTQRDRLSGELDLLGREQLRVSLSIDQRQKKQNNAEQALTNERQRAT